jgi:hypothetical protein
MSGVWGRKKPRQVLPPQNLWTDDKIKAQKVVEELRAKRADMQVFIQFFEKYFLILILILLFQHKLLTGLSLGDFFS